MSHQVQNARTGACRCNNSFKWLSATCLMVLASACSGNQPAATSVNNCTGTPAENKSVVLAFYKRSFMQKEPTQAFAAYVSTSFIEHKPDVPEGTREAVASYLAQLMRELPQAKWEILRTASEGDLVFLHARFTAADGQPAYAIADVFRLENCKIVEHWDVVGAPRDQQPNPHSRF